ncbi:hypothetical protein EIN_413640 [Entamoeba invadens IP1]|uniref:Uncharacterized protein n=1 Tax=Entamoeba invadens IP1 TaxID=370355 RepID=L7FMQ6_ENTIV|nr:hypothetical protein EIN_413640 [Entamoeba invadens IP1]ELP91696.1 hypothetical protein EIN_413640 [Entamoeba invadens IP1]|eukprot:XP_004258467.1 hypothetical protein EIN_413640 [Entamoeba invadens IP1]
MFTSTNCADWEDEGSIPIPDNAQITNKLPDYYYVIKEYYNRSDCKFSESNAYPSELLYTQCTKDSNGFEHAEIKDGKMTISFYGSDNCSGNTNSEPIIIEVDKCVEFQKEHRIVSKSATEIPFESSSDVSSKSSHEMSSEGAFNIMACLGLFIMFMF